MGGENMRKLFLSLVLGLFLVPTVMDGEAAAWVYHTRFCREGQCLSYEVPDTVAVTDTYQNEDFACTRFELQDTEEYAYGFVLIHVTGEQDIEDMLDDISRNDGATIEGGGWEQHPEGGPDMYVLHGTMPSGHYCLYTGYVAAGCGVMEHFVSKDTVPPAALLETLGSVNFRWLE